MIIAFFEKIAHKLQDWTGKNNFWYARITIFLYMSAVIIFSQFLLEDKESVNFAAPLLVSGLIASFMFLILSYLIEYRTLQSTKFKNSFSMPDVGIVVLRIYLLVCLLIEIPLYLFDGNLSNNEALDLIKDVTYLTIWYFLCVTPKPPTESKIKKFFKSLFQRREIVSVPS